MYIFFAAVIMQSPPLWDQLRSSFSSSSSTTTTTDGYFYLNNEGTMSSICPCKVTAPDPFRSDTWWFTRSAIPTHFIVLNDFRAG